MKRFISLLFGFIVLIEQTSCATLGQGDFKRPWPFYFEKKYKEIFNCDDQEQSAFKVHMYKTKKEYEAALQKYGFPAEFTAGFYDPTPPSEIHICLAYREWFPSLLHESVHQFFSPYALKIPWWINEGFATYMETGIIKNDKFIIGRINKERLYRLKKMIVKKTCPSIMQVLSINYGEQIFLADYDVCWGIIYKLMYDGSEEKIRKYIEMCKQNVNGQYEVIFGQNFANWEKDWQEYILQLK